MTVRARVLTMVVVISCLGAFGVGQASAAAPSWEVLAVTGPTHLPPISNEIQKVSVDATGGTFSLTFESHTTAPIPFDATGAEVGAALTALPSIGGVGGEVEVSGGPGDLNATRPYFVRFSGALAALGQPELTADASLLAGGAHSATVSTRVDGGEAGEGEVAVAVTNVGGAPTNGSPVAVEFELPPGLTATSTGACQVVGQIVTCTRNVVVQPGQTTDSFLVPIAIGLGAPTNSTMDVVVGGGGAGDVSREIPIVVSSTPARPGIQALWAGAYDENGAPYTQSGGHPARAGTGFMLNTITAPSGVVVPPGDLKDLDVQLPPGFIGNPTVTARCPSDNLGGCGAMAKVGLAKPFLQTFGGEATGGVSAETVFNGDPSPGYAAQFTFKLFEAKANVVGSLRSDADYGVSVSAPNIATAYRVYGATTILEGAPTAANGQAFLTNPTGCAEQAATPPITSFETNTWQAQTTFSQASVGIPPVVDCDALFFDPSFTFQPSSGTAATGVGATVELSVPQDGLLDPTELASPHLKKSVVTLPQGLTLNPSAANGLQACSTQEIGLKGTQFSAPNPIRFTKESVGCPDASKIGTVDVVTPLLDDPLHGTIYLAAQGDNPFDSLLALYLVVEDTKTGTVLKLPGEVQPNSQTGQLTAVFDNNPQLPFSSLKLKFRGGGPRSTMATPDVCGKYTTVGSFTPWSAPESGPAAETEDSFTISEGVGGSASCPRTKAERPFGLGFEAGSTSPIAGAHSPFTLRITRPDGAQEIDKVSIATPPGFAATLAGVPVCSDAQVAQAQSRSNPGDGQTELDSPSCPASSQVGTTTIGAGVGSQPYYVKTGKIYRTGAYKGAKQSLTFIVPIVAGPFDLGVQVVRTALNVNPTTAQITAESDPIPQILQGIPVQIRDIRVDLDRPNFTINPTNCNEMAVSGQITGGSGAVANVSNRFQVDNCAALGFKPSLKLTYKGQTKRGGYPAVRAVLTQPPGQANISATQVLLPLGSFIAQDHVNNPCTRAQWAANACPPASILGTATAWSPLLDQPLTGNVYFRSNGGERELPDLVAALKGEVDVELVGFIDAVENKKKETSRVRNTFAVVPDAPVSRFELKMKGGKFGLIENSKNLCKSKNKATVRIWAHNGRTLKFDPKVATDCRKKGKGKKGGGKGR